MISVIAALVLSAAPVIGLNEAGSQVSTLAKVSRSAAETTVNFTTSANGIGAAVSDGIAKAAEVRQTPTLETPISIPETRNIRIEERINLILREGQRLEQECRWSKALHLYEAGFRRYPEAKRLQAQYSRMRVICDIQKRCTASSYMNTVSGMNYFQIRNVLNHLVDILAQNCVYGLTYNEIFYREVRCMEIALCSSVFCESVLPQRKMSEINAFRERLTAFSRQFSIRSHEELVSANFQLGQLFQDEFRVNGAFLILEGLFGHVVSLDSYSEVLLPLQFKDLNSSVSGSMVGVGIEFRTADGQTQIQELLPDTPAEQSTLRRGDRILAINGEEIHGWTQGKVSEKLAGTAGSQLNLQVQTGTDTPRNVTLFRKELTISSIQHSFILPESDGIAYIRLNGFQKNSSAEMDQKLRELSRQGMSSLILDLRGNPGGTLDSAIQVADLFLSEGPILWTQYHHSGAKQKHEAHPQNTWNVPLVVLVDEKSASASEIFAGAINDLNRGTLVGKRTFGKGAIQSMYTIADGPFVLKLTTAQFFSPNEQRYNHVGVTPDYVVQQTGKPVFEEISENRALRKERKPGIQNPGSQDAALLTAMQILSEKR